MAATPAVESPKLLRSLMPRWLTTSAPMPPLLKALLPSAALSPRRAPTRISAWPMRSPKRLHGCFHFPPSRLLHDTSSANILGSSLRLMRGSYLLLCSFGSASFFHWLCLSTSFLSFSFASTSRLNFFMSFAEAGGGKLVSTLTMGHYK